MEYGYLDKEVKALVAERDRLASENAELKRDFAALNETLQNYAQQVRQASAELAANATLDQLREAIRRQHAGLFYVTAAQHLRVGFDAKKETDNG